MKYKIIDNQSTPENTRAEYLYNTFCLDERLTPKKFVDCVKTAYYKYNAEVYQPAYAEKLKHPFNEFLNNLTGEACIIDIGAGTGESYWLVKGSGYVFNKYFYIEPFKQMISQFKDKENQKVVIVNDYFESQKCTDLIKVIKGKKIFIMCAVLRTLDDINEFLDILSQEMQQGDKLFLPIEPNNEYFGKYYKLILPFFFITRVYGKVRQLLLAKSKNKLDGFNDKHPLDKSLQYLRETGVVNDEFTKGMLYAIVYYNNYLCWRSINIPDQYNEGFFTVDQVVERLSCEVTEFNTWTYLYGITPSNNWIEKILHKLFPNSGSTFTAVLTKP